MERRLPGVHVTGSVLLTVAGCVVAGLGDLTFDPRSYAVALAAAVLQVRTSFAADWRGSERGLRAVDLKGPGLNQSLATPVWLICLCAARHLTSLVAGRRTRKASTTRCKSNARTRAPAS